MEDLSSFEVLNNEDEALLEEDLGQGFSYVNRQGDTVTLDSDMHDWVVKDITKTFDRLDQDRTAVKNRWKRVEKAVRAIVSDIEKDRFWAMAPLGKQSVQTLISHFWGRSLQTPKIFFSVDGEDEKSKEMAPIHKQNLMRHFKKDRLRQKFDKALSLHGLLKGVIVGHISVACKKRELHGPKDFVTNWENTVPMEGQEPEAEFIDVEQKIYEGSTFTVVDPYDFVFDTENHENWDSCWKGHKSWMVYEDIESDPSFKNYEELYEKVQDHINSGSNKAGVKKKKKKTLKNKNEQADNTGLDESGRLEVIEYHGDYRLKDGTYLRNWMIVVAGRDKVIYFDRNPMYVNPFKKWLYEETEDGWGISPIEYILPFIDASSILLSTGVEAAKMAINPPMLAEEKHFEQRKIFLKEGAIVKWKANTALPNTQPIPIQLNYQAPFPYVQLFESQAESTTAATRQLSGNVTTNDKVQTATEFNGLQVVGNLILDRLVDLFNMDFKIPVIEAMALVNAMFNPEERQIPIDNEKGVREYTKVTTDMYFGNYEYIIEDNKSENERKQNAQEKISLLQMGISDPIIGQRLKRAELFKELWRDFGYGQPAMFFMDDMEFVDFQAKELMLQAFVQSLQGQAAQRFMTLPPEIKEYIYGTITEGGAEGATGVPQPATGNPQIAAEPGMGQV